MAEAVSIQRADRFAWTRARVRWLSRGVILLIVFTTMGSLFWHPANWWQGAIDILLRSYIMFLGTVMAHEGTHGHLGRGRRSNNWWGRLALLPVMVPYTNFRKTHNLHHAYTNDPQKDPDYFMATRKAWQLPFRAVAMPHSWFFWLRRRGRMNGKDIGELIANYTGIFLIYGIVCYFVGWQRILVGVVPPLILVSQLLWIPFAVKTHEGWSMGSAEARSHDYYGHLLYWFTLGLSLHRVHHLRPRLSWIELLPHVRPAPRPWWRRMLPVRDIRPDESPARAHD